MLSTSSPRIFCETSTTCPSSSHSLCSPSRSLSAICCLRHTYVPVHQTQSRISKLDIWPCLTCLKWQDGQNAERLNLTVTSSHTNHSKHKQISCRWDETEQLWEPETVSLPWLLQLSLIEALQQRDAEAPWWLSVCRMACISTLKGHISPRCGFNTDTYCSYIMYQYWYVSILIHIVPTNVVEIISYWLTSCISC